MFPVTDPHSDVRYPVWNVSEWVAFKSMTGGARSNKGSAKEREKASGHRDRKNE